MNIGECGKIMIVDDEAINRDMLNGILTAQGYDVFGAINGEHALSMIPDYEPDIILLDVIMPIMDGFEATAIIREKSDIPIIGLSGNPSEEYVNQAEKLKMDGCLKKPIDVDVLTATLKLAIDAYKG